MKLVEITRDLKKGVRFRRPHWPQGEQIQYKPPEQSNGVAEKKASLIKWNADGTFEPFSATNEELDATDWIPA